MTTEDSTHSTTTRAVASTAERSTKLSRRRVVCRWLVGIGLIAGLGIAGGEISAILTERRQTEFKQLCRAAVDSGDWDQLQATSEQWTQWDSSEPDAWLFLAEAHRQQGRTRKSVDCLLAVSNNPQKEISALLVAGSFLFEELNRPLEGELVMRRLLTLSPSLRTAHHRLIFFYAMTLQRVKMIEQIYSAIQAGAATPDSYVYLMLAGHLTFNNAYALNQLWLQSSPDEELFKVAALVHFNELRDRADNSHEEPQHEKANRRKELLELKARYPKNTTLLRYLLRRAIIDGDLKTVSELLADVPSDAGNDSVFWHIRGWYFSQLNRFDEAEESYRRSIEQYRFDWNTWHGLASVLRKAGRIDAGENAQNTGLLGKELRKQILQLPTTQDLSPAIVDQMREYAIECGDVLVADALHLHRQMSPHKF